MVGDFCGLWHPAMARVWPEAGGQVRAFEAGGFTYRERLVYVSDSDRVLGYRHVAGIAGVDSYDARVSVVPDGAGCKVNWTAEVTASMPRAAEVAAGTRAIFEAGIAALAGAVVPVVAEAVPAAVAIVERVVGEGPRLALSVTSGRGGTLCLFLHGIGGGRLNWRGQLAAVGGVMRAAALDLRGYGGSRLGPGQSTVEDYCDDILRVAKALGAGRLVLVGLSYGSWIATSFAMRHPGMLAGLVLSGGCTGMSEAGQAERAAFRAAREGPLNAGQGPADFAPGVVKVLAGPGIGAAQRAELLATMAAVPAATYRDALACFTNPPERFDFARLTMPVLMMTGSQDVLAPPAEIRGVAARIGAAVALPDMRFEVIMGAGHVCNVEAPEAYNRHLIRFLQRVPQ